MKYFKSILVLSVLIFSSSCKKDLVDTNANDITDTTGVEAFNASIASGITMAFFHASWCHNCEEQRPTVETVSEREDLSHVNFVEVEYDDNKDVFEAHDVVGFPHILFFVDGAEKQRLSKKGHSEQAMVDILLSLE